MIKLSIVIVSYNTRDLTLQALHSAWEDAQNSPELKNKTEVIVVDNHSQDKSVPAIRAALKNSYRNTSRIKLIANRRNLGFARANNQGVKMATGQYLLLLNSDTIVQSQALSRLVATFDRLPIDDTTSMLSSATDRIDKLGILAATLINPDGTLQPQGGHLPTLCSLTSHLLLIDDLPLVGKLLPSTQHTGWRQTEKLRYQTHNYRLIKRGWVGGTAMMIRRQLIEEIGPLDENIFMYGEDVEFCLRARHHHWDIAIHPGAKIIHLASASSNSANALKGEFNSYLYIWSKHQPLWQLPLVKLILKTGALLRWILFGTILTNKKKARVYRQLLTKI